MAKHIMGGHVAIGQMPYREGQYEQMFGRCDKCLELVDAPHKDDCPKHPEYERLSVLREQEQRRLYGDEYVDARKQNAKFIAAGAHQPIKYRSHQLLDSERGR